MDEMSLQEGIDYILGRLNGLEAMLAVTIKTLDRSDRLYLTEKFNELRNTATRINLESEIQDVSTPGTEPFYRGLAEAIDGLMRLLNSGVEEGN